MKTRTIFLLLFAALMLQHSSNVFGQTRDHITFSSDGIVYEYEKPTKAQLQEWASKNKDACFSKIQKMKGNLDIAKYIMKEDPCYVYLVLISKSLEDGEEKQSWIDLYSLMDEEQKYKFYDIIYRERYRSALIDARNGANQLFYNFYHGSDGYPQDKVQAMSWLRHAADLGSSYAENNLGWYYYIGETVEQDYKKAFEWFVKAADKGNNYAVGNLGMMYYYGQYVEKDPNKAFELLNKACDSDDPPKDALRVLSACYRYGVGTAIDSKKAEELLKKSAELGDEQAIKLLENEK